MNDQAKIDPTAGQVVPRKSGLALLRDPFPLNQISKLPKPTKAQTDEVRADFKKGIRCQACGGWHHPKVVHLDYVGHAALTDRLLDADPEWNWEPVATDPNGLPLVDQAGGMWIRLTVCGHTRLGYGHADGKKGGDAIKEVIGDALRNAAMRFGAALDLWHKGDLHSADDEAKPDEPQQREERREPDQRPAPEQRTITRGEVAALRQKAAEAGVPDERLCEAYSFFGLEMFTVEAFAKAMKRLDVTIAAKSPPPPDADLDDEIPY